MEMGKCRPKAEGVVDLESRSAERRKNMPIVQMAGGEDGEGGLKGEDDHEWRNGGGKMVMAVREISKSMERGRVELDDEAARVG